MSQISLELLKRQIRQLSNREVDIEKTKSGKFICKFLDFNMSPLSLLGDTEEDAYQKLYHYLKAKKTDTDEPDLPPAA